MKTLGLLVIALTMLTASLFAEEGYVKRVEAWPNQTLIVLADKTTGAEMVNSVDSSADTKAMIAMALSAQSTGQILQLYVIDGCTGWCVAKVTNSK